MSANLLSRLFGARRSRARVDAVRGSRIAVRTAAREAVEALEGRLLMSTYKVTIASPFTHGRATNIITGSLAQNTFYATGTD